LSPGGTEIVAVTAKVPVAVEDIWQTAVNVTVPPGRRVTLVFIFPLPNAADDDEPGDAAAVQLADVISAGQFAVTAWATAVEGPELDATMV